MKKAVLIGICLVALTGLSFNQNAEASSKGKPKFHHNNVTVVKKTTNVTNVTNTTNTTNTTNNNTTNVTNVTNSSTTVVNQSEDLHNVAGVKIDAPNLIEFSDNWTLGAEGGKDVVKNLFYDSDDSYFEADKGYFAYIKVTYKGTLFSFKKDE